MVKLSNFLAVLCSMVLLLNLIGVQAIAGFGNGALPRATPSTAKGQITSLIQELCQRHPGECKAILAKSIRREIIRLEAQRKRMIENNLRQAVANSRLAQDYHKNQVEQRDIPRFQENDLDLY